MQHSPFVVLLAFVAAGLLSQEPERQGGPGGRGGSPGFALFGALNTDGGESLTAAEIDNAPAILRKLDANGDGKVTPDEFPRPAPRAGGPGRGGGGSGVGDEPPAAAPTPDELAAMLMAFDKNKDGKLTKAEVPERMQGIFARADEDKDGVLTPEEIKKTAAAQPPPTAGGRGGPGREGEGRGGPPRRDPLISALDQDGDGTLSADEIVASPASLRKLDANADGMLTLEEVFAGGRGRG